MKRLIDLTCTLGNQGLAFRSHDESEGSVNRGNFVELLHFLTMYDPVIQGHLAHSTVFKGTSPDIQNDLIKCIGDFMRDKICEEVEAAPYIAMQLDETSDIQSISQLSTVLRYTNNQEIVERFIGFTDVSADRSATGLFNHIEKIGTNYRFENKFVGQT